jgi:peroxiredoxin
MTPKSKVPNIDLPLVSGGVFNMAEASPEKFQIIVAYRGVHCPKCKTQLQALDEMVDSIRENGHGVVAISMDTEEDAKKAQSEWGIKTLPIAHSLELLNAKSLGLFISDAISDKEPHLFAEPGVFVVRPDGTLYAEFIQNTPFGRPDIGDLVKGLNFVAENDYPTRGTSIA